MSKKREYIHTRKHKRPRPPVFGFQETHEELLNYKDKKLLVLFTSAFVVPGFIRDKDYECKETKEGLKISRITLIPKELQDDVAEFLHTRGYERKPYFWKD